jgi:signal transduction histidine kinase
MLISRFNTAFGLMSVIPLLTCFYLITVRFFSIQILSGDNWLIFLMVLVVALVGLLFGHQLIRDIVRQLVEANTKLAKLNEAQSGFVSNVAHEFRSPLAVFKGALDNLADGLHGELTPDQKEPVLMCQRELNRLTRLVRDLLELARIESGKLKLTREELDLKDILASVGQMFGGLMKERGLSLAMDLQPEPARVTGDRDRLKQVFVNLLGNAVKYTDVGGVRVRLAREGDAYRVEIADTGRGIADSDLERVFDKFERVGTQQEEGSGLGLPIAKDIVELHQGRIWVESQRGQGSRFIVLLPANV